MWFDTANIFGIFQMMYCKNSFVNKGKVDFQEFFTKILTDWNLIFKKQRKCGLSCYFYNDKSLQKITKCPILYLFILCKKCKIYTNLSTTYKWSEAFKEKKFTLRKTTFTGGCGNTHTHATPLITWRWKRESEEKFCDIFYFFKTGCVHAISNLTFFWNTAIINFSILSGQKPFHNVCT